MIIIKDKNKQKLKHDNTNYQFLIKIIAYSSLLENDYKFSYLMES